MRDADKLVILFDVDNTLLDNDELQRDLREHLTTTYGKHTCERYWTLFEELRTELGYADYLGALERYRLEDLHNPRVLNMANWMVDYPFVQRLYPRAVEAVLHARNFGVPVILSDGDAVFQPRKISRSGLWSAFEERVLIYVHKEQELEDVERWHPADHYILVDDKLRILDAVKSIWSDKVTTVFVRQGHYALDTAAIAQYRPADVVIEKIGDLLTLNLATRERL